MVGRKAVLAFLSFLGLSFGVPPCLDPVSTVDWSFFVDSLEISGTCACSTSGRLKVGLSVKVAEPIAMVEVVRRAWDFPCFGIRREGSVKNKDGTNKGELSKVHVHWMEYPVFAVLGLVMESLCVEKGEFDLLPGGMSELNPLLWDDALSVLVQPWKLVFANPLAMSACLADCVASSTAPESGEALRNSLFWCAGCWGTLYPTTTTTYGRNAVTESALVVARLIDVLHESGQLFLYSEAEGLSVVSALKNYALPSVDVKCQPLYFPTIVKSQYYLNLAYPTPSEAVPLGKSGINWSFFKDYPSGEDFIWVVWRVRECCLGYQFP